MNLLAVDLIQILRLIGPRVEESEWQIAGVECADERATELFERLAEGASRVDGRTLLSVAADPMQLVDGVFSGYRRGDADPWVRIRAVDSSEFDVETEDEELLMRMKQCFADVSDWSINDDG